jgi:hypothetical protein
VRKFGLEHLAVLIAALMVMSCQPQATKVKANANNSQSVADPDWPASLSQVLGSRYPFPWSSCRTVGENYLTNQYLEDHSILVGCMTEASAAKLGGKRGGVIDGAIMVSIDVKN